MATETGYISSLAAMTDFREVAPNSLKKKVSVAPMMDWTDRHCRYFMRLLSPSALLYTEMVAAAAVHHGDKQRFLRFNKAEHPVAVQLGGSNPDWMASAAASAAEWGYDEVNINVGCPSDRVQSGQFGACLMATPELVAECVTAMRAACDVPVTVKTRIGIDDEDSYEFLQRFVETVAGAGCEKFVVHARIAILEGLSPKQNREIPPLNYERVYRLKQEYPEFEIVLNGGVADLETVDEVLNHVDGVMIGREAYNRPYFLAEIEKHLSPGWSLPGHREVVERMLPYVREQMAQGVPLMRVARHMMGLITGMPGARKWRRHLSQHAHLDGAGPELLIEAFPGVS
jgi:tRNA-dihydrouridine synthase A